MPSSNFFAFIEDFSSIKSTDKDYLRRTLKKYPYFATAALFLARADRTQETMQRAALRAADRKVLRYWLDDTYREQVDAQNKPRATTTQPETVFADIDIHTEEVNAFEKLEDNTEHQTDAKEVAVPASLEEVLIEEGTTPVEGADDTEDTTNFFEKIEPEEETVFIDTDATFSESFIPPTTTDSSFFEELQAKEDNSEAHAVSSAIPPTTTDASFETNFFDELEEEQHKPLHEKETENIDSPIDTFEPSITTDANFFEEIESDDTIFEAAEKDLENYKFPEEDKKDSMPPNDASSDAGHDSSFFDDI